jgi:hypothetical protein
MNRKEYKEPMMQVAELRHGGMLLTSGLQAIRNGYGAAEEETWE